MCGCKIGCLAGDLGASHIQSKVSQCVIPYSCEDHVSKAQIGSPHSSDSACPPPSAAAQLSCGSQNNRFHGKVMAGSAYIFSSLFQVVQPLEKEVAEALASLIKSSEEISVDPCVLAPSFLALHL